MKKLQIVAEIDIDTSLYSSVNINDPMKDRIEKLSGKAIEGILNRLGYTVTNRKVTIEKIDDIPSP